MSLMGHSRRFDLGPATSGLLLRTDIVRPPLQVRSVPKGDIARLLKMKKAAN